MPHFQITSNQIKEFKTKGFLHLKNAVPAKMISELQVLLANFNQQAISSFGTPAAPANSAFIDNEGTPLLIRMNELLRVFPNEVIDLLACPAMMAIARDLSGPGTVPVQCDALFKHTHPSSTVLWHQDAIYPRDFLYLNIGVYLDDADSDDGCLLYVNGSQHEKLDICELTKKHGWGIPKTEEAPVKAGDILIQDMMVLHGSRPKNKAGVRRTIYVEMRPEQAIAAQGIHSEAWLEGRKRWMGLIARRSAIAWPEHTHGALPRDLRSDQMEIEQLLMHQESPLPANYCSESILIPEKINPDE